MQLFFSFFFFKWSGMQRKKNSHRGVVSMKGVWERDKKKKKGEKRNKRIKYRTLVSDTEWNVYSVSLSDKHDKLRKYTCRSKDFLLECSGYTKSDFHLIVRVYTSTLYNQSSLPWAVLKCWDQSTFFTQLHTACTWFTQCKYTYNHAALATEQRVLHHFDNADDGTCITLVKSAI